ncbi:hypothetical protein NG798_21200 [Ancylothrix sp. C2]|uniref:hypothetical protein n=1 Tax=Ancylothrix sp. D3o TaxID=2953691 RepID=UPI0021BB6516|nr:hypothetical protein [Ancylothrix sp. D3o]MCT7952317.1 hypothetical protein [Ancylothrix sp. D3o]
MNIAGSVDIVEPVHGAGPIDGEMLVEAQGPVHTVANLQTPIALLDGRWIFGGRCIFRGRWILKCLWNSWACEPLEAGVSLSAFPADVGPYRIPPASN